MFSIRRYDKILHTSELISAFLLCTLSCPLQHSARRSQEFPLAGGTAMKDQTGSPVRSLPPTALRTDVCTAKHHGDRLLHVFCLAKTKHAVRNKQ